MSKVAYMFPGQGSQFKGMGAELFANFPKETSEASNILGYDLKELCLEDPQNQLKQTQYTQPSIYFMSCLDYLKRQEESSTKPDYVCGHSLGEYAALFSAGVFDLLTGLSIVNKRAELMGKIENGSLMAILGSNVSTVKQTLIDEGISSIDIANYNTPDQLVIGGPIKDLEQSQEILEKHEFKCIPLSLSGAFHTRYMEPATIEYMRFLMNFQFFDPKISIISSTSGTTLDSKYVLEILGFQLVKPVRWVKTIQSLIAQGVKSFTEVGPGEVLTKLNLKIFSLSQEAAQ